VGTDVRLYFAAQQRQGLGADGVIGSRWSLLGDASHVLAPGEGKAARVAADREDYRETRSLRDLAPESSDFLAGRPVVLRLRLFRTLAERPGALPLQILLGEADEVDHPLIGLAGRGTEGEDAMGEQHHADRLRPGRGGEALGAQAGEIEARHHVRD